MKGKLLLISSFFGFALCANAQSMDWLCHPGEFSEVTYLGHDLFKVRNNLGKWGIIQADGKKAIDVKYDSITPFVENKALLLGKKGERLLGIINSNGEIIQDLSSYEYYTTRFPNYKENRLPFANKFGLQGFLNEKGDVAIDPLYLFVAPFQDGITTVQFGPSFNNDYGYYGLRSKGGTSAIYSDDRYDFLSAPVGGYLLGITGSRKGANSLRLLRIDNAKLKKEKTLEDGMIIVLSDDGKSIDCQKGHHYYIDNQWRIYDSNTKYNLPSVEKEPNLFTIETSKTLGISRLEDGLQITYLGNPIVNNKFYSIATIDDYAIVHSKDGKVGILKLNKSASIEIRVPSTPIVFHHAGSKDILLDVDLKSVYPDKLHWYRNDTGYLTHSSLEYNDGKYQLRIPYFKSNTNPNEPIEENVDIAFTYDGLDWMHHTLTLESVHQNSDRFEVTISGNNMANINGRCNLTINIKSLNGEAKGKITIPGIKSEQINGESIKIPLVVNVPDNATKNYSFTIKIEEDGCPVYSTSVSKTIQGHKPEKKEKKKVKLE